MELLEWSFCCIKCRQETTAYSLECAKGIIEAHKDCISREDNERRLNEWRKANGYAWVLGR